MDREKLAQYAELWDRKQKLKKDLDVAQKRLNELQDEIVLDFEQEGVTKIRVDGRLFYQRTDTYFSMKAQDTRSFAVLDEFELGHLVETKVDGQKLRGALLEIEKRTKEPIDAKLEEIVNRNEKYYIRVK